MINVAVIGVGNMGWHHARVYAELEESNLVAVSDLNTDSGRKVAHKYKANFYSNYQDMLAKEKIDAISLAVPTSWHKEVAIQCIKMGIPVLIEKPIADSLDNGKKIIEESEKANVLVTVGHIERFNPAVQKLKEIIEQDKLGKITSILARRVGIFPPQIKDANVIVDLAVHDIDICNFLLNRTPTKIFAKNGKALNSERADFASLFLDYDGVETFIQVNWITPVKIRELNVTGIKGYAELNYVTQKLKIYESNYEKAFDSFGDFVVKFGTPNVQEVNIKTAEPLKLELSHFISCVKDNTKPLVTAMEGLVTLGIALRALESCQYDSIMEVPNDL